MVQEEFVGREESVGDLGSEMEYVESGDPVLEDVVLAGEDDLSLEHIVQIIER